ncbi:FecR domain-containing protein [candidate division KSB1 bacterium]|nr:FecR domain-containing protein [candidate division KSB1 bacterium]
MKCYRASLAFLLATFFSFASAQTQPAKDIAVVLKSTGQVRVTRAQNSAAENAARGTRLNSGNVVRTGDAAAAALIFTDDKSILKMRENSKVSIAGQREEDSIIKTIKMEFGQLWAKVTRSETPFKIETPSGVAAVKGTQFYCILDGKGNMIIFCLEGAVEIFNKLGKALVNAGQTGIIGENQPPVSRPSNAGEVPTWGDEDQQSGKIEIELQDKNGQKKKLILEY